MAGEQSFMKNLRRRLEGLSDLLLRGDGPDENVPYRLDSLCRDILWYRDLRNFHTIATDLLGAKKILDYHHEHVIV